MLFSVSLCVGGQKQKYTRNRARAVKVQTEGGRQAVAGASIVPQVRALRREEGGALDREEGGKQDCMCVFWICAVLTLLVLQTYGSLPYPLQARADGSLQPSTSPPLALLLVGRRRASIRSSS